MTEEQPTYQTLAAAIAACRNCIIASDRDGQDRWEAYIESIMDYAPSGSGVDNGTALQWGLCRPDRLVFAFDFHHMNDIGMYCGWSSHTLTVTPAFSGIELQIDSDYTDVEPKFWNDETDTAYPLDPMEEDEYLWDLYYDWLTAPCRARKIK